MSLLRWSFVIALCAGLLGCSEVSKKDSAPPEEELAAGKVKAIKWLADEMAKDADGPDARGALEQFRITPMDAQKFPNQANEVVEIYKQRIQGKYRGFVAQEIQNEMSLYLPRKGK